jgi:hypothetical protein
MSLWEFWAAAEGWRAANCSDDEGTLTPKEEAELCALIDEVG